LQYVSDDPADCCASPASSSQFRDPQNINIPGSLITGFVFMHNTCDNIHMSIYVLFGMNGQRLPKYETPRIAAGRSKKTGSERSISLFNDL
jgi:hypothetical protein